jgi:hypothetical protein
LCRCIDPNQHWYSVNEIEGYCENFIDYNKGPCEFDFECKDNLVCKKDGPSCTCPMSVTNENCDCPPRTYGNEFYYNEIECVVARRFNESCNANYECQRITQGTSCINNVCKCESLEYFNLKNNKCENQLLDSIACSQVDACRSNLGLSCQNSVCKCNPNTQFWDTSMGTALAKCINFLAYNTGICSSDFHCNGNLICRTVSTTSCMCPTNVATSRCDCPARSVNREFYWNGVICVTALGYNQRCSADYMCHTLTQLTKCINGLCTCLNGVFSIILKKCVFCPPDWIFYRNSCFRGGKRVVGSFTTENIISACYNEKNAVLAKLRNSDSMTIFNGNSFFPGQWYFFDARRTSSLNFVSNDGTVSLSWISPPWMGSNIYQDFCAVYVPGALNQRGYYEAHDCHLNTDPVMCEIVLN